MGRKAKRADPIIYLRQRLDRGRVNRKDAMSEWAEKVFFPKMGRMPFPFEQTQAIDSGELGNWIEEQYKATDIRDHVIVVGKRTIPIQEFRDFQTKPLDSSFRKEMEELRMNRRKKRWREESESEAIQAAIAGKISGAEAMQAEADKLYAEKVNAWEIEQIFSRADKTNKKRK